MKYSEFKDQLICMDLDGTLCNGESWTEMGCLFAEPIQEHIDISNKLYISGAHIIINTARPEKFRHETEYWLSKHGIRYHAMNMNSKKCGSDFYCDDKALTLDQLINIKND